MMPSIENIKENLDRRICDCVEGASNTETYREFIRNSEKYFCLHLGNIDKCDNDSLVALVQWLDDLWGK
jgi:hypothetical protein